MAVDRFVGSVVAAVGCVNLGFVVEMLPGSTCLG